MVKTTRIGKNTLVLLKSLFIISFSFNSKMQACLPKYVYSNRRFTLMYLMVISYPQLDGGENYTGKNQPSAKLITFMLKLRIIASLMRSRLAGTEYKKRLSRIQIRTSALSRVRR